MEIIENEKLDREKRQEAYQQQVLKLEKKTQEEQDEMLDVPKSKPEKPKLRLRNYKPHDSEFKKAERITEKPVKIASQIKDQLIEDDDDVKQDEIGIETLQPRKPDWDLKRDLNPKMKKLNKRTHKVLTEMLKDRLAAEKALNQDKDLKRKHPDEETPINGEVDRYKDMLPDKGGKSKFR